MSTTTYPNLAPSRARKSAPPSAEEKVEFARAMECYKRRSTRMFPTWSEVLEVLRGLGYAKAAPAATPLARVNRPSPQAEEIGRDLARLGGIEAAGPQFGVYEFDREADRDRAVAEVRSEYGWTSVEPG